MSMRLNGAGKYDDHCTWLREQTGAEAVALVILGGDRGAGFAAQAPADVLVRLPAMLELLARRIREQLIDA